MIHLADIVVATTADLLNGTRLQSLPSPGILTCEFIADLNDASAAYDLTIELPNGDTPVNVQRVSAVNPALAGVMDSRMSDKYVFPGLAQGGHVTITLTETGTCIAYFRITFVPI